MASKSFTRHGSRCEGIRTFAILKNGETFLFISQIERETRELVSVNKIVCALYYALNKLT